MKKAQKVIRVSLGSYINLALIRGGGGNMMKISTQTLLSVSIALVTLGAMSATSYAQILEEITVTAERRTESIQDVPIAITAFTATDIARAALYDVESLQHKVPGLTFEQTFGRSRTTLRGVSSDVQNASSETGVAMYVDGVPVSSMTGQLGAQSDLERIEVLRGPQGTLYGRNVVGGAINYWTKVPGNEAEGSITAHLGNGDTYGVEGGYSFPLVEDVLSARISGSWEESDGHFDNVLDIPDDPITGMDPDESETFSARLVLNWRPTDNLQFITRASHYSHEYAGPGMNQIVDVAPVFGISVQALGGFVPPDFTEYANNWPPGTDVEETTISETISWDIADLGFLGDVNLKSLTAYRNFKWVHMVEFEGSDLDIGQQSYFDPVTGEFEPRSEDFDTISQEFVLTSQNDSRLEWTAGFFYYHREGDELARSRLGSDLLGVPGFELVGQFDFFDLKTESIAAFAQVTWSVFDWARLDLGARYTDESKEALISLNIFGAACQIDEETDFKQWTPHVGLEFDPAEHVMLYLKATRGFRSGGFNNVDCVETVFDEETMWSYEAGIKSRWLDERLQLNLAAFYLDYGSYQVYAPIAIGQSRFLTFPGSVQGVEVEADLLPVENLTISLGASFMDSEFDDATTLNPFFGIPDDNIGGNPFPRTPEESVNLSVDYVIPAELAEFTLHYDFSYKSNQSINYVSYPFRMPSYSVHNAWLHLANPGGGDNGLELQFYVNNFTDEEYLTGMFPSSAPTIGVLGHYANPRTYGVRATYNF